ncbi:MAG: porin family protein [Geobacteraceae bacterium]
MRRVIVLTVIALSLVAGSAMAESIEGRLGLTGKLGVIVPLKDSDVGGASFETRTGFAAGGGLIYGFNKYLAGEIDIIHAPSMDVKIGGTKVAEAQFTDFSLGLQFRIMPDHALVPYLGVGGDAIKGDIDDTTLDWTFGGHVNGGIDYFLNKSIALNADVRGIFAAKSDIKQNDVTVGKFDPISFVATVGVRLFLPQKW